MSTKPKASEAAANTEAKTGTASEAQSGTMSSSPGNAGTAALAVGADTFTANEDRLIVTIPPGSEPTVAPLNALRAADGILNIAQDAGDASIDPEGRYTIVVQGPVAGRWRIGRKFTAEPTSIPASELTEAQVTALRDDPSLMVSVIAAPY